MSKWHHRPLEVVKHIISFLVMLQIWSWVKLEYSVKKEKFKKFGTYKLNNKGIIWCFIGLWCHFDIAGRSSVKVLPTKWFSFFANETTFRHAVGSVTLLQRSYRISANEITLHYTVAELPSHYTPLVFPSPQLLTSQPLPQLPSLFSSRTSTRLADLIRWGLHTWTGFSFFTGKLVLLYS